MNEFADDILKFDENVRTFSKQVEKHCRKRRNCSLRAISPSPTVFSKDLHCRHVKTTADTWERVKRLDVCLPKLSIPLTEARYIQHTSCKKTVCCGVFYLSLKFK